jgi:hypothetical protein
LVSEAFSFIITFLTLLIVYISPSSQLPAPEPTCHPTLSFFSLSSFVAPAPHPPSPSSLHGRQPPLLPRMCGGGRSTDALALQAPLLPPSDRACASSSPARRCAAPHTFGLQLRPCRSWRSLVSSIRSQHRPPPAAAPSLTGRAPAPCPPSTARPELDSPGGGAATSGASTCARSLEGIATTGLWLALSLPEEVLRRAKSKGNKRGFSPWVSQ